MNKTAKEIKEQIEQIGYKEFYRYYEEKDKHMVILQDINKQLQQENKQLKDNWNKLKEFAQEKFDSPSWASCGARYILEKMQELEKDDNNE